MIKKSLRTGIIHIFNIILILPLLSGCVFVSPVLYPRKSSLEETTVRKAEKWLTTDKILLLDISGIITDTDEGGLLTSGENMIDEVKERLKKASKDPSIKAIVLRINSPGGGVTASDILYNEIKNFRTETEKPVIAHIMDLGASGGYYVALGADKISAQPTAVTGSIGVIAMFPNLQRLTRLIGVEMRIVKSGDNKDIGSIWRDFSEEEREILQGIIDDMYQRFLDVVKENRPGIDPNRLKTFADGRIFTANQAMEAGLIDEVNRLDDALDSAIEAAEIEDAEVIVYKRAYQYRNTIYANTTKQTPQADHSTRIGLMNIDARGLQSSHSPRFMYLWMP